MRNGTLDFVIVIIILLKSEYLYKNFVSLFPQESLQEVSIQEVSELEGVEFTHKEEANEVESQIIQYQVPVNKDGTLMIETDQGPAEVPRSIGETFTLATGGSTENMSEFSIVTSTASGEEKIILVMAPEGSEPEAALSMLKLQSST